MAELIYKGSVYGCVLSDEAIEQIGFDGENLPERICGEDSEELWVRIIRYCDGVLLKEPFELNCEGPPFLGSQNRPTRKPAGLFLARWKQYGHQPFHQENHSKTYP